MPLTQAEMPTDDGGWAAFYRMYDLREIASPRFALLIKLARAEGLLTPLLAGDTETMRRASAALREEATEIVRSLGVSEMVITDEMADAGEDVLLGALGGFVAEINLCRKPDGNETRDLAIMIFQAMAKAAPPTKKLA